MILKKRSQAFLETRIKFVVVKDHEKRHILNNDFIRDGNIKPGSNNLNRAGKINICLNN